MERNRRIRESEDAGEERTRGGGGSNDGEGEFEKV
jgi:hypothetical protein